MVRVGLGEDLAMTFWVDVGPPTNNNVVVICYYSGV